MLEIILIAGIGKLFKNVTIYKIFENIKVILFSEIEYLFGVRINPKMRLSTNANNSKSLKCLS